MNHQLINGDSLEVLRTLRDGAVQCCVTSPPYWGLRDYGKDGQIGLEPTPEAYVEGLMRVFREVRRMLRDDGVAWLNLGDCYATGAGKVGDCPGGGKQGENWKGAMTSPNRMPLPGLKPKDLVGIPWRVAFALQADGWWLRSDVIWSKPNPMPESVKDRPTKSHEYVFLMSKQERYYWDQEAVREEGEGRLDRGHIVRGRIGLQGWKGDPLEESNGRNIRSVWTIAPKPFTGAHFAVMPEELVERCIKAGSREGDVILDPFVGSGTVPTVAEHLGRHSIGIDLNEQYLAMARKRS